MESFLSFLLEKWPYGIWIVIGGIVVYLYMTIKQKANDADKNADEAHIKIEKLPCEKHLEKVDSIDAINAKVDGILQAIQMLGGNNQRPLIMSHSPISLTDYGRELSKELDLESHIRSNWNATSEYIETHSESMNPYDIQQLCLNYVVSHPEEVLSKDGYDKVKSKAYQIGTQVIYILQAAAIIVRDTYFKEHNINVDDVDKHDPNTKTINAEK